MLRPLWLRTSLLAWLLCWRYASGSEVYLQNITIYQTHDRDYPGFPATPDVYFVCDGDSRGKTSLPTVKELNHTYTFEPEDVSLTHVNPGQCRVACAIKDKDTWSKDDVFGSTFQICEDDFDAETHLNEVSIPGEVSLVMQCAQCNRKPGSPAEPNSDSAAPHKSSKSTGKIVTLAVAGAVLAGMVIGLVVARIVRAWHDEDANEARLRFQALYVDSTTDIEDLPEQLPNVRRNDPFSWMARSLRKTWMQFRGKRPYGMMAPPVTVPLD